MGELVTEQSEKYGTFPIVGVGASAGGLEAISELIEKMPAQCGMAFLVVQHLDPQRPSLLSAILATRTSLIVSEADEGTVVEVNHLYVIPPNASMSIEGGCLKLVARSSALGAPTPIDDLFDSLAKDQGANGIGIILSGSGSDGAIGLQTLHNMGAITFAQDESAKYTSMPRTVQRLGCVDLVLPPAAIAAELIRLASHSYLSSSGLVRGRQDLQIDETDLAQLFKLLKTECNIDFTSYKRGTIYRRVARRLALRNIGSVPKYIEVLQTEPAEIRALCENLLIRFTEFFRDPQTFAVLPDTVFSRFSGSVDEPIRIWVAGCATGEETYSIAIALMEYLFAHSIHRSIQIFGTDISEEALEIARNGLYIENIARNVSAERLERFFAREDDYYRVSRAVRDCCTFARQNIVQDPPFSRMDLITCRNLLIYLDPSLQRRVIPLLHYALKPQGVLMLGLSESVGPASEMFSPLGNHRDRLFGKKLVPGRAMPALDFKPRAQRSVRSASAGQGNLDDQFRKHVDRIALDRYAPPGVLCDEEMNILEFRGDTSAFLVNRPGAPSVQLRNLARPGLVVALADAIQQAISEGGQVRRENLRIDSLDGILNTSLLVAPVPIPATQTEGRWFLVFFEGERAARAVADPAVFPGWAGSLKAWLTGATRRRRRALQSADVQSELDRLTGELHATREHMANIFTEHENVIQDLKSSEEEMLSSNEEFQSTNEELETAKEELQSLNEELSTTNDELSYRNRELKDLNDQMVEARDYANAIVETTSEPMLVLQADFRVVRANRAFYQHFRLTPEKTLQASLYSLGDGQWDQPALRHLLEELSPEQKRVIDYEFSAVFPELGERIIRLNAVHLAWAGHALILLTLLDVTERHNALNVLRTMDRQKDEFLATLGHELRNPLAAMRNALTLWEVGTKDDSTLGSVMAVLGRQVNNQVRLVEDLLDVSRITQGVVTLQMEQFDLVVLVARCCDNAKLQIEGRHLTSTLQLPTQPLFVNGDPLRLEQIVTNVLGNAIKYTLPGGKVAVSLDRDANNAVLTITDSGIGLSAELLPTIFDVFVQAKRSTGKHLGGLGIGLALARQLVELHGGHISAESAGLDKGSKFIVRIPALPQDQQAEPPPPWLFAMETAANVRPCRILLVDDNLDALRTSEDILRIFGHDIRTAIDGPSAIAWAKTYQPDIVLLDIGLPGMDGYEVCKALRKLPGWTDTVIVAYSGFGQESNRRKSMEAGFDHHLIKPVDLSTIHGLATRTS